MKATELLEKIRENLKDYPIGYLKRKATDDRYPDSITKRLAIYNSSIYDEIYEKNIEEDYEIKDAVIKNIEDDVDYYFSVYDPGDIETRDFTRELSLYLVLIAKKPLHTGLSTLRMKGPCAVIAFAKMQVIPLDLYKLDI